MNGAQVVWIVFTTIELMGSLINHGERKKGKYNFFDTLITVCIDFAIMKWGGFF